MSNQRIVNSAYFIAAVVVFYVLNELLAEVWAVAQLPDPRLFGPVGIPLVVSFVLTAVSLLVAVRHQKVNPFLIEVVEELREVTWPTGEETVTHTRVVIVTVVVLASLMGIFDLVWAKVSKFLLNPLF